MTTNTDSLYAEHLASHAEATSDTARSAEEAAFEALLEAHPEQAEALNQLRAAQQRLGGALPRTLSEKTSGLHRPAGAKELPQSAFHAKEGATIGDFHLTRLLGRGGMGEVWEAEQASLSRKVALKLMLPDRVSERGLDFFAREARAGGRLSHKGIVSVFGTGVDDGAHWIAMELVDGACDLKRSLDAMRDEAEVPEGYYEHTAGFIADLADALEIAHGAGVIHRDLKPANILVAADDSPKVSDFGLAKLEDELSISSAGELLGTYYYMSPEQVATKRAGIDHRTDVFSLGVVMYEMITLVRPFEGDTTEQIAQKILWEEAPDPKAIRSRVPRDLAVICGKAMEKDPARRYQSMTELAADLRRSLADEPIHAKAPAPAQRVIKWTKRNPTKSAMVVAGIAGIVVFGGLWQRTEKARAGEALARQSAEERRLEAEEQRTKAEENTRLAGESQEETERASKDLEKVVQFQADQLGAVKAAPLGLSIWSRLREEIASRGAEGDAARDEAEAKFDKLVAGTDFTGLALDALEGHVFGPALETIAQEFADQPLTRAQLLLSLGEAMADAGLLRQAAASLSVATEVFTAELGADSPEALKSLYEEAGVAMNLGDLESAEAMVGFVLEGCEGAYSPDEAFTLRARQTLIGMKVSTAEVSDADIDASKDLLKETNRAFGPEHELTLRAEYLVAGVLWRRGRTAEATALFKRSAESSTQVLGLEHESTRLALTGYGAVLMELGEMRECVEIMRRVAEAQERALGFNHPEALVSQTNLAAALLLSGENEEVVAVLRRVEEEQKRLLGSFHTDTCATGNALGIAYEKIGELGEAERAYLSSLSRLEDRLEERGERGVLARMLQANLGVLYRKEGRNGEAGEALALAIAGHEKIGNRDTAEALRAKSEFARVLWEKGEREGSTALRREVLAGRRKTLGEDHIDTTLSLKLLAKNLVDESPEEALELFLQVLERRTEAHGVTPKIRQAATNVAATYLKMGKGGEALALFEARLAEERGLHGEDAEGAAVWLALLGATTGELGRPEEAAEHFTEALELERARGENPTEEIYLLEMLSRALYKAGRNAESFAAGEGLVAAAREAYGDENKKTLEAIKFLGTGYAMAGENESAAPLLFEATEGARQVYGEKNPFTLRAMSLLGSVYQALGRLEEANPLLLEALSGQSQVLGDEERDTLNTVIRVAKLQVKVGNLAGAKENLRMAFAAAFRSQGSESGIAKEALGLLGAICEVELINLRKVRGDEDPKTLDQMHETAGVFYEQGKTKEAEALLLEALSTRVRLFEGEDPGSLDCLTQLGAQYEEEGRIDEAARMFSKELEIRRKIGELKSDRGLHAIGNVAYLRVRQGRLSEAAALAREIQALELKGEGPFEQKALGLAEAILKRERELRAAKGGDEER